MGFGTTRRLQMNTGIAVGAVAVMIFGLGSCALGDEKDDAEVLVEQFTQLLDDRDVVSAAALTSYPNAASASIQQMFDGLKADSVDYKVSQYIPLDQSSGFFTLDAKWDLGKDRRWDYSVQGSVRKLAVGWRISWDPTVVLPEFGHSRTVQLVRTDAAAPRVLDPTGSPLMDEQTINAIKLDPTKMPDPVATTTAVAKAIEPVAPLITSQSLMQDLVVARGQSITAVSLRDADFEILGPALVKIPGVVTEKQPKLIATDRRIVSPLLDALRNVWQSSRDATAGWAVEVQEPDGSPAVRLTGFQGPPPPDVAATLDPKLQLAAADAVVSVGTPATIVAIQPSTGAITAVAQNTYASDIGPIALKGLYPAGTALDIFNNAAGVLKGVAPKDVSPEDSMNAAAQLGLGVDFKVPGLEEVTGQLPNQGAGMEKPDAWNGDNVMVSPFGMAMVAASIARGNVPAPMIAFGQPATTDANLTSIRSDVVDRLRVLMREGVTKPNAQSVQAFSDVTGIATQSGQDSWFIANRGDLAFAVFIKDADGADQAAKMAARLLRAMAKAQA